MNKYIKTQDVKSWVNHVIWLLRIIQIISWSLRIVCPMPTLGLQMEIDTQRDAFWLTNLFKATEEVIGGTRSQFRICLTPKPLAPPTSIYCLVLIVTQPPLVSTGALVFVKHFHAYSLTYASSHWQILRLGPLVFIYQAGKLKLCSVALVQAWPLQITATVALGEQAQK